MIRRAIILLAVLFASLAVLAAGMVLTPEEQADCEEQGGCEIVSVAWLRSAIKAAHEAGFKQGARACLMKTT